MKLPSLKGDFIRSGATILLATTMASLVSFVANVMISNILGPESFGNFKVIVYLFAFLPIIADFGINSSLTKYISEFGRDCKKARCLIEKFLKYKALGYAALIVILFLLKDQIALYFLKDASLGYLVLVGIAVLAFNFFGTFSFIALGFQNFKLFGVSQLLNTLTSSVLAILLSPLGIFYIILGWSLGPLVGNLPTMAYAIRKVRAGYEKVDVKKIFSEFSLPVYPIDLSTNLFTAAIPLMSLFFAQRLVGYYSFAFMFYYVAMLIPNSLSYVLFPKVSELHGLKMHDSARHILKKSFLYYSLFAIAGLLGVAFLFWMVHKPHSADLPA